MCSLVLVGHDPGKEWHIEKKCSHADLVHDNDLQPLTDQVRQFGSSPLEVPGLKCRKVYSLT